MRPLRVPRALPPDRAPALERVPDPANEGPWPDLTREWTHYLLAAEAALRTNKTQEQMSTSERERWTRYLEATESALEAGLTQRLEAARDRERREYANDAGQGAALPPLAKAPARVWMQLDAPPAAPAWRWRHRCVLREQCATFRAGKPWTHVFRAKLYTAVVCPACWTRYGGSDQGMGTPTDPRQHTSTLTAALRAHQESDATEAADEREEERKEDARDERDNEQDKEEEQEQEQDAPAEREDARDDQEEEDDAARSKTSAREPRMLDSW
jgi:hypothetical protein